MRTLTALLLASLILAAGCETPGSVCRDYVRSLNDMWERCGYPIRVQLVKDDGTPATCDDVNELRDANPLVCECIPWAQERSCEEVDADPTMVHPTCEGQHFYYIAD